eukprot:2100708-Pyramimonas_sp.AAC.1
MRGGSACELFARSFLGPIEAWRERFGGGATMRASDLVPEPAPLLRVAGIMTCTFTSRTHDVS